MSNKKLLAASIGLLSCSVAATAADFQIEEVIVTAQKRSESLQDVAVAVQALSGDSLETAGISSTNDLQVVSPGLVVSNNGPSGQVYLRGIGTQLAVAGLDPSVALYLDDQYIGVAQGSLFELADVERIEVLKGPQGTLYGRNATAGAVRVVTKGIDDELSGKLTGSVGNYNSRKVTGTVSVPVSDTFGMRLSGLVNQRDGYVDNIVGVGATDVSPSDAVSELDDANYRALRGKFRWRPNDAVEATLALGSSRQKDMAGLDLIVGGNPAFNSGVALGGSTGTSPDEASSSASRKMKTEIDDASLRISVSGEKVDFTSVMTYWDFYQDGNLDLDGVGNFTQDFHAYPSNTESVSQELQWASTAGDAIEWIAGVFYYKQETRFDAVFNVSTAYDMVTVPSGGMSGPPAPFFSLGDQTVDTTAYAAFGQATYNFDDNWSLTLGGRYSMEEKDSSIVASSLVPVTVNPPASGSEDWNEFTPKATVQYDFDTGMAYFTYARGFKSGGYNYPMSIYAVPGDPSSAFAPAPVDPEILDMYEFGWKTELLDNTLRLNGSLFFYDYTDLQVVTSTLDPGTGAITQSARNAGSAEVLGLDLEFTWLLSQNFALNGGLAYLDSEYKEFNAAPYMHNVSQGKTGPAALGMSTVDYDASGDQMLRAPELSGFLTLSYETEVQSGSALVALTYSYTDEYNFNFIMDDLSDDLKQDAYGLINARASFTTADEKWTVGVWGKNLADEDDYYDFAEGAPSGIRKSHGAPRTYGVDLSYRF